MRKGFTLIELLIVIAIIGLLATLAIVSLTTAQQKARDTKRLADVKQIQNAVELYFSEIGNYPASATWAALGTDVGPYISTMPIDPNNDGDEYYAYMVNESGNEYYVGALLEDTAHDALNGDDDTNEPVIANTAAEDEFIANVIASTSVAPLTGGIANPLTAGINCNDATVAGAYCLSE